MKNISVNLIIMASIMVITLQSCSKYEDGPFASLKSKQERVSNSWRVEKYLSNGTDYTSNYDGYTETYTKAGDYLFTSNSFFGTTSGSGKWELQNNNTEILRSSVDGQDNQVLIILRLTEDEFWYYYMDRDDKREFHLITN